MKILVYEDREYKNLYPLNLLRASYDIKCGAVTLLQRIKSILKNKYEISLHCRNYMAPRMREIHSNKINEISKDRYLLLNGNVVFTKEILKLLLSPPEKNVAYFYGKKLVASHFTAEQSFNLKSRIGSKENFPDAKFCKELGFEELELNKQMSLHIIEYPWDTIRYMLRTHLNDEVNPVRSRKVMSGKSVKSKKFINPKEITISKSAVIFPEVILDASAGRIIIEENTRIEPYTYIKGPVYIGNNCTVKSGSRIYGPCVIGEFSKVSGEIAESIFHSYVNKQHDGFIGHSYVCPFVNFGADTVTSDLKNNYSKIRCKLQGKEYDTGMNFLGSIIGDHSKTSINTMLNTGTIAGIFSNIFGGGFPMKEVLSFSWNETGKRPIPYKIDKALETAKIVMQRRGLEMSKAYENLLRFYSLKKSA